MLDILPRLLLARLCAEAVPRGAEAAVYGAAWSGGRFARWLNAEGNVIAAALRKPAAELTRADARSYACVRAMEVSALARGGTATWKAVGFTAKEYLSFVSAHHMTRSARALSGPLMSRPLFSPLPSAAFTRACSFARLAG